MFSKVSFAISYSNLINVIYGDVFVITKTQSFKKPAEDIDIIK